MLCALCELLLLCYDLSRVNPLAVFVRIASRLDAAANYNFSALVQIILRELSGLAERYDRDKIRGLFLLLVSSVDCQGVTSDARLDAVLCLRVSDVRLPGESA